MTHSAPLSLAVVGHTNTGKTSLMRTLLRDTEFGEVRNAAATTRHVEEALIRDGSRTLVKLYDTPGLEDAGGVLDWLEQHTSPRDDGIERLHAFLDSDAAAGDFNQEAKVLRQLLHSDMALYVVDAREPVLPKYKDELTVLSWCAKPVMPVFNFTAQASDLNGWMQMLARRNLHVYSSFDTVAFDFEGEITLWDNLATMLPERNTLDNLIALRRREWQELSFLALNDIAGFLLEAAAYRNEIGEHDNPAPALATMQQNIRLLEQQLQQQLLQHYRFYRSEIDSGDWALKTFRQDPFDSSLLKEYGIRTGKGAATGALIGLGVDVLTLGGSLGLGTALGSVIGGVLPNMQTIGDKLSGKQTLYIDAETLTLLAARALDLLTALQSRGHAAQTPLRLISGRTPWPAEKLPAELRQARNRPQWSSLNGHSAEQCKRERHSTLPALHDRLAAAHKQAGMSATQSEADTV